MADALRPETSAGFAGMVLAATAAGAATYYALFRLAGWMWHALPAALHG